MLAHLTCWIISIKLVANSLVLSDIERSDFDELFLLVSLKCFLKPTKGLFRFWNFRINLRKIEFSQKKLNLGKIKRNQFFAFEKERNERTNFVSSFYDLSFFWWLSCFYRENTSAQLHQQQKLETLQDSVAVFIYKQEGRKGSSRNREML